MKIVKLVMAVSMVLMVSMGLAFLLISSIIIGAQTSTAAESKIAKIEYNAQMESLRADYEDARKDIEDDDDLTDAEKDEELALLEESYNTMVDSAEMDYEVVRTELRQLHKERLTQAFVYEVERLEIEGTVVSYKSQQKLTAPAGLMITGIVFLLTSGPLFMGAIMFKKQAESKSKKEETPEDKKEEYYV